MEETISSCLHKCAARNTRNTVLQTTVNSEALQAPFTPVECINTDKDTSLSSELSRELIRYIFIKRILFSSGVAVRLIFSSISQPFRLGIFLGFYFFVNRANCVFVFFFFLIFRVTECFVKENSFQFVAHSIARNCPYISNT